jgi:hypothetical protein
MVTQDCWTFRCDRGRIKLVRRLRLRGSHAGRGAVRLSHQSISTIQEIGSFPRRTVPACKQCSCVCFSRRVLGFWVARRLHVAVWAELTSMIFCFVSRVSICRIALPLLGGLVANDDFWQAIIMQSRMRVRDSRPGSSLLRVVRWEAF